MNRFRVVGILVAMLLIGLPTATQAELITNGSFDGGTYGAFNLPPWSTVGTVNWDNISPDGKCASLCSFGVLSQSNTDHPFSAGEKYTVSFLAGEVANLSSSTLNVALIDTTTGTTLASQDFALGSTWKSYTAELYPVDSDHIGHHWTISFSNTVANTWNSLDNVSVTAAIPEPSAITVLVTGMIGLLAYAWRRRK